MLWIPLIFMCLLKTLKSLVPFSIIANILIVISFSITLYYIFRDINLPDSVNMIASIDRMPLFLATVIFAIEGIGTVSVHHSLFPCRRRRHHHPTRNEQ